MNRTEAAVYISLGLTFGAGLGMILGIAFGSIAVGMSLGAGTGLVVGILISVFKNK